VSRASALAYRSAWALLRKAPQRSSRVTFEMLGELAALGNGKGTRRLKANLASATGRSGQDLADVTHAGMRSYMRYWIEIFQLPAMDLADVARRQHFDGAELLFDAYAEGKGVILALPHMGNWDVAGVWLVQTIGPFTTVAERLEPADLFERFVAFRESLGMEVIAHKGHEQPPMDILAERLRAGGVVCLLADRDLSEHGVPVTLCGGATSVPAGPALLALRTGAALLPVTPWASPTSARDWSGKVHPRLNGADVVELSQQMADAFTEAIQTHPEDWHMLGRVWKD
jgi:lauroyl/myristoyl acyltransferase